MRIPRLLNMILFARINFIGRLYSLSCYDICNLHIVMNIYCVPTPIYTYYDFR